MEKQKAAVNASENVTKSSNTFVRDKKVPNSKRPSKQRSRFYGSKLHELQKHMGAHLSKELRKSFKKRSLGIRKGDKVKVMRGKFKGKSGKVAKINRAKIQIFIEGIMRKKSDGKEIFVPLHPSNLLITEVFSTDKRRAITASATKSGAKAPSDLAVDAKQEKQVPKAQAVHGSATKSGAKAPAGLAAAVEV